MRQMENRLCERIERLQDSMRIGGHVQSQDDMLCKHHLRSELGTTKTNLDEDLRRCGTGDLPLKTQIARLTARVDDLYLCLNGDFKKHMAIFADGEPGEATARKVSGKCGSDEKAVHESGMLEDRLDMAEKTCEGLRTETADIKLRLDAVESRIVNDSSILCVAKDRDSDKLGDSKKILSTLDPEVDLSCIYHLVRTQDKIEAALQEVKPMVQTHGAEVLDCHLPAVASLDQRISRIEGRIKLMDQMCMSHDQKQEKKAMGTEVPLSERKRTPSLVQSGRRNSPRQRKHEDGPREWSPSMDETINNVRPKQKLTSCPSSQRVSRGEQSARNRVADTGGVAKQTMAPDHTRSSSPKQLIHSGSGHSIKAHTIRRSHDAADPAKSRNNSHDPSYGGHVATPPAMQASSSNVPRSPCWQSRMLHVPVTGNQYRGRSATPTLAPGTVQTTVINRVRTSFEAPRPRLASPCQQHSPVGFSRV